MPSPLHCPFTDYEAAIREFFFAQRVIHAYRPSGLHYYWVINGLCSNGAAVMAPSLACSLLLWGSACRWWMGIRQDLHEFNPVAGFIKCAPSQKKNRPERYHSSVCWVVPQSHTEICTTIKNMKGQFYSWAKGFVFFISVFGLITCLI